MLSLQIGGQFYIILGRVILAYVKYRRPAFTSEYGTASDTNPLNTETIIPQNHTPDINF